MSQANQPPETGTGSRPARPGGRPRSTARTAIVGLPLTILMPFIMLWQSLRGLWSDRATRGILLSAAILLAAGTIIFMFLEGLSPVDSFYFSFVTLATIGYGDFVPTTDLSKLVMVAYSTAGLGIMAALISSIAAQRRLASRE